MKAMIMAAGLGTRLGDITRTIPKALIDINGRTVLEHIIRKLYLSKFDDIIINVHHLAEQVEKEARRMADILGIKVTFSDERDNLLETGGGVYKARTFFGDESFMVYNGDILTDIDLEEMYSFHVRSGAAATIATRQRKGNRFFLVDEKGNIRGWYNRQTQVEILTVEKRKGLTEIPSMAVAIYSNKVFDYMQEGVYTMTSVILEMAANEKVNTFKHESGFWVDIGSEEQLHKAREIFS